ncbi:hypothetical protein EV356DRAFT_508389 [Viridothelium virens]|uniref:Uncharacterized protein n=1 Tax=Viridothelium virens TaxID=1048519 RepID=A0A6A6GYC8_VIRVR|nr:hypothetical protein EV356DRAFT_508389 [Viridothelium virens]
MDALSAILCASGRAFCCTLKISQKEDGTEALEVLRKYISGNSKVLQYVGGLPKLSTSTKKGDEAVSVR